MGKAVSVFLLFLSLSLLSCSRSLLVFSYNVENLFDDLSSGGEYPEYRTESWNRELYPRKLAATARVIRAAARRGPDVIALQEVESLEALRSLRDLHLAELGYRYLVFAPWEQAVTSVAVLSRIPVLRTRIHAPAAGGPPRPILELQLQQGGAMLYLFNNHWKSKAEGSRQTAPQRRQSAGILAARLQEILEAEPAADLLVLGDLNENLDEYQCVGAEYLTALLPDHLHSGEQPALEGGLLFVADRPERSGRQGPRLVLYDPWYEIPAAERGSSVYQGRWQTHDRILLSPGLFDRSGYSYRRGSFRVLKRSFLLLPGSGFPRRFRPSADVAADPGYSDHLPLLIRLQRRR